MTQYAWLRAIFIALVGGVFALYGLAFCVLPSELFQYLLGGSIDGGATALTDFRATYGGATLGIGLAILWLQWRGAMAASLDLIAIVLLAMALARSAGMVIEGDTSTIMLGYLASEVVGFVLALWLKRGLADPARVAESP